jgi:hypothetical protein
MVFNHGQDVRHVTGDGNSSAGHYTGKAAEKLFIHQV